MKSNGNIGISVEIDKLTNSIENAITGDIFDTEFYRLGIKNKNQIKKSNWFYNWQNELYYKNREVYKLTIKGNTNIIQGLISLSIETDHVFIHFVESSKPNQGERKIYYGVGGNLFAFASKRSKEEGFSGYVGFRVKTNLVEHYKNTLGAKQISGERMYIDNVSGEKLINRYFNS